MATYYVSPSGSNTAPYDTWAKAAHKPSTVLNLWESGAVIIIDGGVDGITYNDVLATTGANQKILKSTEDTRKGPVTISGDGVASTLLVRHTGIEANGLVLTGAAGTNLNLWVNALGGSFLLNDITLLGGNQTLRVEADGVFNTTFITGATDTTSPVTFPTAGVNVTFNFLRYERNYGPIYFRRGGTITINNGLFIGNFSRVINSAEYEKTVVINNSCFIANCASNRNISVIKNDLGTITCNNCLLQPNPQYGSTYFVDGTVGVVQNDCTYGSPKFVSPRRDGIVSINIDDVNSLSNFEDIADILDLYNLRGSIAVDSWGGSIVEKTNVYPTSESVVSESIWSRLRALVARGHHVYSHGRGHIKLAAASGLTISYLNGVATGIVSIVIDYENMSGVVNLESTIPEDCHTIDVSIGAGTEDVYQLALAINALSPSGRWSQVIINDISARTAKCLLLENCTSVAAGSDFLLDAEKVASWEIVGSKSDIEQKIGGGYVCNGLVNPYNSNGPDCRAESKAAGYLFATSDFNIVDAEYGAPTPWFDNTDAGHSGLRVYNIFRAMPKSSFGTTEIRRNTRAFCEWLMYFGGHAVLYGHDVSYGGGEYTAAQWEEVIKGIVDSGIDMMPIHEAVEYVMGSGTTADGGYTYVLPAVDESSYNLLPTSPCIGAGADVGLITDADGNAIPGAVGYDIGPYSYMPGWTLFDESMPALTLSPDCPGKLKQVQEWRKVASAREIESV